MPIRIGLGARTGSVLYCFRILAFVLLIGLCSGCIVEYQDSNVQRFGPGEAAVLNGKQLYLTRERARFHHVVEGGGGKITAPWGWPPYYYRAVTEQSEFLVDPTGHETIDFTVSDPYLLPGSEDSESGFPSDHGGVYVGSDGTIAFAQPGAGNTTFPEFFSTTQVSVLPMDATVEGARVSYGTISDILVVTFENVEGNSVQCIMMSFPGSGNLPGIESLNYDDIVITYREVGESTRAGVVGISWLSLETFDPQSATTFLAGFEEGAGGQANLLENTDTTTGGRVILPLP